MSSTHKHASAPAATEPGDGAGQDGNLNDVLSTPVGDDGGTGSSLAEKAMMAAMTGDPSDPLVKATSGGHLTPEEVKAANAEVAAVAAVAGNPPPEIADALRSAGVTVPGGTTPANGHHANGHHAPKPSANGKPHGHKPQPVAGGV